MTETKAEYRIQCRLETIEEQWRRLFDQRRPCQEYNPGIYFLFRGNDIVYVGKSLWAKERVFVHQRDKDKYFDSFTILPFLIEQLEDKELEYIFKFQPIYNKSLPPNQNIKPKHGWAAALGVKVGVIGRHIRKNKILPCATFKGRLYFHKNDMGAL